MLERKKPIDKELLTATNPERIETLCNDIDDTITDEITDPKQLFDRLIKRNKQHFSQANETYLAKPPHSETLPPFHYSPAVDEVLKGNLNSFDSLQPELKALLTEMKALAPQNTTVLAVLPGQWDSTIYLILHPPMILTSLITLKLTWSLS